MTIYELQKRLVDTLGVKPSVKLIRQTLDRWYPYNQKGLEGRRNSDGYSESDFNVLTYLERSKDFMPTNTATQRVVGMTIAALAGAGWIVFTEGRSPAWFPTSEAAAGYATGLTVWLAIPVG